MKLNAIGPHQTEIVFKNGVKVLFSYAGVVAAYKPGAGYMRTEQFLSKTTERHIASWLGSQEAATVPQDTLDFIVGGTRP